MGSSIRILGVDPGYTTGIVYCTLPPDKPLWVDNTAEIIGLDGQMVAFEKWMAAAGPDDVVVCERYVPRNTAFVGDSTAAQEPIGVLKYLCSMYGVELILPIPTERKSISNHSLRESGYWIVGEEHSRQALRHVLAHTVNNLRHSATRDLLRPRR